jgi:hypothetical protein
MVAIDFVVILRVELGFSGSTYCVTAGAGRELKAGALTSNALIWGCGATISHC